MVSGGKWDQVRSSRGKFLVSRGRWWLVKENGG